MAFSSSVKEFRLVVVRRLGMTGRCGVGIMIWDILVKL